MEPTNKLPVFKLKVKRESATADTPEDQQEYIALVDHPAVELECFYFASHNQSEKFKFAFDEERQIITGVALVAEMPIKRKMKLPGQTVESEFYVVFDKPTIFEFVQKFFRKGYTSNFIMHHSDTPEKEGIYLFESIFVDSSRGVVAPKMFEGVNDGSWIISLHVPDKAKWTQIKKDGIKGLSVQGFFGMEYIRSEDEKVLDVIADLAKGE